MPKSVVVDPGFDWQGEPGRRRVPWDDTIFYETHVKGFTKLNPAVPEDLRGTYAGLGHKDVIAYIKKLGVTSVELLPIHTFVNDSQLEEKGLANYWGYNTIGFFAPDPRYAADVPNSLREFKEMVSRFHDASLEVILDVVYNHTAEGNERGPTLSFKGIDNASYYRLLPDQKRYYINDTGTGKHGEPVASPRHPDGDGQPALLGRGDAHRWVSLRSRDHPRARAERVRQPVRLPQGGGAGSGARVSEARRRAVGYRAGRLSGRQFSRRLGGVDGQVPR